MKEGAFNLKDVSIGLALSGGGSRAIAFHLGCMRALHDRRLLDRISVLSTVSGGSVIGAMWAYSNLEFTDFDLAIQKILRNGLSRGILRTTFMTSEFLKILLSLVLSWPFALVSSTINLLISASEAIGVRHRYLEYLAKHAQPPIRRFASRTTAFEKYLDSELFHGVKLNEVRRARLQVIINATELRNQTAFHFGSNDSGTWRFGRLTCVQTVAKAVAASAAFPALLPVLDERLEFDLNGVISTRRTLITDGGVYDNMGTSCLIPGRNTAFNFNSTNVDFIVACIAGQGAPSTTRIPYFWGARMIDTVNTTHRRTHSLTFELLHRLRESGALKGFVMPYLGQQDDALPCPPPKLISREDTIGYPTDFSAMSENDMVKISLRGEQLTRNLIETHYPDLS